jgi:large conductance mechanosensitive channel
VKGFVKEFQAFMIRGNALELAVGVVIGAAFTAIINSIVNDLIMPLIGLILGGVDMSAWGFYVGDAFFGIGNLLQAIITFVATGFVLFLIVKGANKLQGKTPPPPAVPKLTADQELLTEIRDLLKQPPVS